MKKLKWNKLYKGKVDDIEIQLDSDIKAARVLREDDDIKFYVGTDSQKKKKYTVYVTAIVMYLEGRGGVVYYTKEKEKNTSLFTRLWNETYKAIEVARELNDFLKPYCLRVNEVHADLNASPKHKSNQLVKSCIGYIQGMGFEGQIKPRSWCASKVANKMTK